MPTNPDEGAFTKEERAEIAAAWRRGADAIERCDDEEVDRAMDVVMNVTKRAGNRLIAALAIARGEHGAA